MYGLLGLDNIWLNIFIYTFFIWNIIFQIIYLKSGIWGCKTNLNIEKTAFVLQGHISS